MKEIIIKENEAGQRIDKYLRKFLSLAPKSFLYKMLRKKNIILNGKKSIGNEMLQVGDQIKFFLSDETIQKFSSDMPKNTDYKLDILYEDKNVLIINKPAGILSQKSKSEDISINDEIISYLMDSEKRNEEDFRAFRPSVCNRLDRNTSGIIVAGKTLYGLQALSEMFKLRTMEKYYLAIVKGEIKTPEKISGYLNKDTKTNKVKITPRPLKNSSYIETYYEPVTYSPAHNITVVKVKLITGRSHQIRAHLASIGHPIIGDSKYGDLTINKYYMKNHTLSGQLLHSQELKFPELDGEMKHLSGMIITAPIPKYFKDIIEEIE